MKLFFLCWLNLKLLLINEMAFVDSSLYCSFLPRSVKLGFKEITVQLSISNWSSFSCLWHQCWSWTKAFPELTQSLTVISVIESTTPSSSNDCQMWDVLEIAHLYHIVTIGRDLNPSLPHWCWVGLGPFHQCSKNYRLVTFGKSKTCWTTFQERNELHQGGL